jgi:hypothetical protein
MRVSPDETRKAWMQDELPLPGCELFVQLGDPESIIVHPGDPGDG